MASCVVSLGRVRRRCDAIPSSHALDGPYSVSNQRLWHDGRVDLELRLTQLQKFANARLKHKLVNLVLAQFISKFTVLRQVHTCGNQSTQSLCRQGHSAISGHDFQARREAMSIGDKGGCTRLPLINMAGQLTPRARLRNGWTLASPSSRNVNS